MSEGREMSPDRGVISETDRLTAGVSEVSKDFINWLDAYGETSRDHQSFFAGSVGRFAKSLYYRNPTLGTAAVAPMILFEAFLPSARRFFHEPIRFPIADAHYAMGFAFLYEANSDPVWLDKAVHFLNVLKSTRCEQFKEYCWGYPFDWVTRVGVIKKQTPLITTTPYVYEAFLQVYEILEHTSEFRPLTSDLRPLDLLGEYKQILESIASHAQFEIKDAKTSATSSSCDTESPAPLSRCTCVIFCGALSTNRKSAGTSPAHACRTDSLGMPRNVLLISTARKRSP